MTPEFKDYQLRLIKPDFESPLTDTIIELEHLRKLIITCTTPSTYFLQIKKIFHLMESLGSAVTLATTVASRFSAFARVQKRRASFSSTTTAILS